MLKARFTFKPNPRGLRKLERGPQMGAFVDRKTKAVSRSVKSVARYRTGYFKRSIKPLRPRLDSRRGWVGRVITTDPFWHLEEFGSINNPPNRSFELGVHAAGLEFHDRR